jgi:hypothetical protein
MLRTNKPGPGLTVRIIIAVFIFALSSCTVVPDDKESEGKEGKLDIYFVSDDFKPDDYA